MKICLSFFILHQLVIITMLLTYIKSFKSFKPLQAHRLMSMSTQDHRDIRIATFNVLSSHLGGQDWYRACRAIDLDPNQRLITVKTILDDEIMRKSIICLQEVSMLWTGICWVIFG